MKTKGTPQKFQEELKQALLLFLEQSSKKYPEEELLRIDLHCHDYNSTVPDELIGRILNVPETWLPTKDLIKTLRKNKVDVITITNHNNARSCFECLEKGEEVLVGAEFSCTVPDFNIGIHVLTYGFSAEQEKVLNKLRKNLYQFLQYCKLNDLPTIWAHPLYHYNVKGVPTSDFFRKLVLLFERFEVLNGQRDTWQNMLVKEWLEQLTPDQIEADAAHFNVDLSLYCKDRYKKSYSGGSDSHMGIFSGQTGTLLHVPQLKERQKTTPLSELALEAIRNGAMVPYGNPQNSERLTIAFLDYVCQVALYRKDPGMMRILLHKGTVQQKVEAFIVSNLFAELAQNKKTMRFVEHFHKCLTGKVPSKSKRYFFPKDYRVLFDETVKIAKAHELPPVEMIETMYGAINTMISDLNQLFYKRFGKNLKSFLKNGASSSIQWEELLQKVDVPSDIRSLFSSVYELKDAPKKSPVAALTSNLATPFLSSTILLGAQFTSTKVLYNTRPLLNEFSERIGKFKHPKRMLWLTDTFDDKNGVSTVLQAMHQEVKSRNLPIDFLVCSDTIQPDDHLIVVKPQASYTLPNFEAHPIRVPDINQVQRLFQANEYDRIICSTEGTMGLLGLYLKHTFTVKTFFYLHTDWIMYVKKVMNFDIHSINRVRRFSRAYYKSFDELFVLNTDHKKWLSGKDMEIAEDKIHLTAHWVDEVFSPQLSEKERLFSVDADTKIILFVGRLSFEKGIKDIAALAKEIPKSMKHRFVFVGEGPASTYILKHLPNALLLGWQDKSTLAKLYSSADVLLLPSKFDTFSCVVLEALSCSLPVVSYKSKGPKEIIEQGVSGYLANGINDLTRYLIDYLESSEEFQTQMKQHALNRSKKYIKERILEEFLVQTGLTTN